MIEEIERRFLEITKLPKINLAKFPILKTDYIDQQQKTSAEAAKERGYITTPIFLVDIMISMQYKNLLPTLKTCDLCAGEAGQFTIRLMRFLYNRFNIDVENWLKNYHTMTELDLDACATLVYIYGPDINLYVGDSMMLNYSDENESGILFFNETKKNWYNISLLTNLIHIPVVKNNLKILKFIFKNYNDKNKLTLLKNRLAKYEK